MSALDKYYSKLTRPKYFKNISGTNQAVGIGSSDGLKVTLSSLLQIGHKRGTLEPENRIDYGNWRPQEAPPLSVP